MSYAPGPASPPALSESQFAMFELLRWVRLLWSRRHLIIGATLAVAMCFGIRDKFFSVKMYRAQAVITPVDPDASLAGSLGIGGLNSGAGAGNGIASLLNLGGQNDNTMIAQQYIAIMTSFAFTSELMNRYHLERKIVPVESGPGARLTRWAIHERISSRFQAEYDYKSGNLLLYFIDSDPGEGAEILGFYLASLREKVRAEQIGSAAAAAASLQDEIRKTSDALLQNELYELVARQIEREKIAQVEGDFAFKVIEPPVVPDQIFAPRARRDATLAASIVFVLSCALVLGFDFVRRARAQMELIERARSMPPALLPEPPAEPPSSPSPVIPGRAARPSARR
ncbi:MAG TPA: Wzz/FepE/Etk N-terminal domain-containing protein [Candidatus Binataceae bacterium]|nr:Wzz/FepE/Etk N-terminal domain-containing protein [Candidatus Binataceae bacterium]